MLALKLPIEKPSAPSEVTGDTHAMTPAFEENHTVAPTAETQNAAGTQPVVRRSSRSNKFQGYVGGQEGKRKSAYHASLIGHVDARRRRERKSEEGGWCAELRVEMQESKREK